MIKNHIDIIRNGLVLHLDTINLDCCDRVGSSIVNLVEATGIGTLTNGAIFNSTNGSIDFDGVDDFIEFPLPQTFDPNGFTRYSESVWFKNNTDTGGITNFYNGPVMDLGLELEIYFGDVYVAFSQSAYAYFTYGITGSWVNFSYTYDGAGATNADILKFYVNGVQVSLTFFGSMPSSIDTITTPIDSYMIGVVRPGFGNPYRYFQGNIAHILTYNTTLSAADVKQNYDATKNWF